MSRYCTVKTQFKDKEALIAALMETGKWTQAQVEINDNPHNLYGFQGDRRSQKAQIIIRRKHIGRSANDIGFTVGEDGSYEAIISEYDSGKYGHKWISRLKSNYAYHQIQQEQESRGRTVSRSRCSQTGRQRIEVTGYR